MQVVRVGCKKKEKQVQVCWMRFYWSIGSNRGVPLVEDRCLEKAVCSAQREMDDVLSANRLTGFVFNGFNALFLHPQF